MKKMNKFAIILVLAVVLIAASSVVVLGNPIPGLPEIEGCEVNFGFGILQRLFPRFNDFIQGRGCALPLP